MQEVFLCEEDKVTQYHRCGTEFKPTTPLAQQIQGFDLSLCGNFVRVLYRNARVMNNKWYRYVGNVESAELLPTFLPQEFKGEAETLLELLATLDPPLKRFDEQDDRGVPKWRQRFVQTYYVYGAHKESQYQWMRFSDQERTEIPNLDMLEIPGGKLDQERLQRIQDAYNATPPREPSKKDLAGFCEPEGAEHVMVRSPEGTFPENVENLVKEYDPFDPDTYGIRHLDVISVGSPGAQASRKTWYWFNGYDWVQGEGSYQDLRNWSTEDLGFVFYKGLKSLDQCMIPCEDPGDTVGSQRYYKGVAGVKYCEQIASGYTLCEEETIDFDCSSEDFPTAIGTITHAHCDHYSNIHSPGSDCYPTEPTFRLTSQSVHFVRGTNRVVDRSGNSSSQPSSSSNTQGYSSASRSSTETVYISAHQSYGSNPYNGEYVTKETDAEGAIVQKDGRMSFLNVLGSSNALTATHFDSKIRRRAQSSIPWTSVQEKIGQECP